MYQIEPQDLSKGASAVTRGEKLQNVHFLSSMKHHDMQLLQLLIKALLSTSLQNFLLTYTMTVQARLVLKRRHLYISHRT